LDPRIELKLKVKDLSEKLVAVKRISYYHYKKCDDLEDENADLESENADLKSENADLESENQQVCFFGGF
jgi:hypothetical protein